MTGWTYWPVNIVVFLTYWSILVFQSKTGALEGPEVDGFVKDMMELVKVASWLFLFINTLYFQEEGDCFGKVM